MISGGGRPFPRPPQPDLRCQTRTPATPGADCTAGLGESPAVIRNDPVTRSQQGSELFLPCPLSGYPHQLIDEPNAFSSSAPLPARRQKNRNLYVPGLRGSRRPVASPAYLPA